MPEFDEHTKEWLNKVVADAPTTAAEPDKPRLFPEAPKTDRYMHFSEMPEWLQIVFGSEGNVVIATNLFEVTLTADIGRVLFGQGPQK